MLFRISRTLCERLPTTCLKVSTEPGLITPSDFELAREILSEAIKQFGSNLGVRSLDLIIRS